MAVRYRPMRPNDAKECVEIVAAHPFVGPRYGSGTTDLRTVWLSLLGREAFRAVVFEDGEDTQVRIMGVGVSAFVSHDFLLELKTPPFFWARPEMTKRVLCGESPLLSDKQVRQANAGRRPESSDLGRRPACGLFAVRGCKYSNVRCVCRGAPEVSAEGTRFTRYELRKVGGHNSQRRLAPQSCQWTLCLFGR